MTITTLMTVPKAEYSAEKIQKIGQGWNPVRIKQEDLRDPFCFQGITEQIAMIIIEVDEHPLSKELINLANADEILINKKGQDAYKMKRPQLILVCKHRTHPEFIKEIASCETS